MNALVKVFLLAGFAFISANGFCVEPEGTAGPVLSNTENTDGVLDPKPTSEVRPNAENGDTVFSTPLPDAVGNFETAIGIGAYADKIIIKDLQKLKGIDSAIASRQSTVDNLQQKLNDLENTPLPPEPEPLANQNPNAGQGGGGSGGGGSGGGDGGGNQPPEMASIPQSSGFTLPENPKEVTPDFASGLDGGSDRERTFNPSSSSIGGYTPPPLDLSKPANNGSAPGQFGPAQIAAGDMPKLKTLDSAANPGTGAGAGGANAGGAGGAGGPSGMAGGAPSGGGGGGDSQFGNLGNDGGGEGGSGINVRDAGWGSGGDGGGSSEGSSGGNGTEVAEKSSNKFPMNQLMDRKPSDQGRFIVRSKPDGSIDDSIFGKVSFYIQDSCGFIPNSKTEKKPAYCDKAIENDLQLAYSEGGLTNPEEPAKVATAKQLEPLPVRKPRAVKKGLREIASTPRGADEVATESEDLLEALRARAGNI
jgi:hypothetical protein